MERTLVIVKPGTVTSIASRDHSDICDLYHTAYTSVV